MKGLKSADTTWRPGFYMFFVKGGLRAPFISSRVGPLVQRGPHYLCFSNGGPNFLRGPCRTMVEAPNIYYYLCLNNS